MELIVVRHGEPDVSGDLTDPPLTQRGQKQAVATAAFLKRIDFDAIYVSPQRRAQQTSVPIVGDRGIAPVTEERIAEFDYELGSYIHPDSFKGMTSAEANAVLAEYQSDGFRSRVLAGFDSIIETNPGKTVAAVCHGGVINALVRNVLDTDSNVAPNHASVTRITASRTGVRSVTSFNEHSWLLDL